MLCHLVSKEIAILLRCLAPEILCTRKRPNAIFLRVEASSDSSLQLKAAVTDVSPLYLSHALAVNQVPKAFSVMWIPQFCFCFKTSGIAILFIDITYLIAFI